MSGFSFSNIEFNKPKLVELDFFRKNASKLPGVRFRFILQSSGDKSL